MSIPKTIGRYEILDELGRGTMGSVFRAKDPAMDRLVAVKTILSVALAGELGEEYRQRFIREARAAGALAHPGIVPVFDVGEEEGTPYLVMEFVRGQTLDAAMKKGVRFSLERVCEIGQQIAEALGHAHHHGVIHRDIKPANILLASPEAYGTEQAKITDFGVAKMNAGGITTTGQMLGTPAFMPPEQFTGAPIDSRADLFSLGVILYWLATGEQPFPGETMTTVSYKIVHTEAVPPAKLNPAIPAAMEAVILKCLAKSPDDRFQTGEELAQAMAQLRAGAKESSLLSTAPLARGTAKASEDTYGLNSGRSSKSTLSTATLAPQQSAAPARKKNLLLPVAAILLLAVAAAGGWYRLPFQHFKVQQSAVAVAPAPVPNSTAAAPVLAPEATPAAESPKAPTTPAPHAQSATVPFDPKTLDPRKNAHLKVELDHFPAGLAVTVEMNRKIYWKAESGDKAALENLFVPPGVQEFRVTVRDAADQKTSNIVSAEFLANKRMTLKIELRPTAKVSSASSPVLDPAAQIIATLKADRFF
ncbi:MAG: serine/threonine-protein kinase [Terracidiphilus sp.]